MIELTAFGGRVVVEDAAGADLGRALAARFPAGVVRDATPAPADYRITAAGGAPGYAIERDGTVIDRAATTDALLDRLCPRLELDLAVRARDHTFVHAGVVAWRGAAILVPGVSGTGKTTLVAELVRRGAQYYSDDWAVLDQAGTVHAFPCARRTGPEAPREPLPPLPVGLVVATVFRPGSTWEPTILRGARARLPIVDNTVVVRERPGRALRVAASLPPELATLESPRPDAAAVAPAILEFADALHAGRLAHFTSVRRTRAASLGTRIGGTGDGGPAATTVRRAPYLRVEDLLTADEHRDLLAYAVSQEPEYADSGVYRVEAKLVDPMARRSRTLYHLDERIWGLFEARVRRLLPHVRRELGVPWFRLGTIERQLHAHRGGDFFGRHVDNAHGEVLPRRVSAVYYFHRTPRRFDGGALYLYDEIVADGVRQVGPTCTAIEPLDNSIVFFPSGVFHEVEPVRRHDDEFGSSRFTITFWCRESEQTPPAPSAPLTV